MAYRVNPLPPIGVVPFAALPGLFSPEQSSVGDIVSPSFRFNPSDAIAGLTISANNRLITVDADGGSYKGIRGTVGKSSGIAMVSFWIGPLVGVAPADTDHAWHWASSVGFANASADLTNGTNDANQVSIRRDGAVRKAAVTLATYDTYSIGVRIDAVYDFTNSRVYFRRGEGWWNSSATADPATNTGGLACVLTPPLYPFVSPYYYGDQQCSSALYAIRLPAAITYPWGG